MRRVEMVRRNSKAVINNGTRVERVVIWPKPSRCIAIPWSSDSVLELTT